MGSSIEKALEDPLTKQPTLIAIGSKASIQQIILKIEDYGFPLATNNMTEAVDYLFKSHYVFNLEYSASLMNFFVFLQTQVYGLKYQGRVPPRVTEVAMAIKAQ